MLQWYFCNNKGHVYYNEEVTTGSITSIDNYQNNEIKMERNRWKPRNQIGYQNKSNLKHLVRHGHGHRGARLWDACNKPWCKTVSTVVWLIFHCNRNKCYTSIAYFTRAQMHATKHALVTSCLLNRSSHININRDRHIYIHTYVHTHARTRTHMFFMRIMSPNYEGGWHCHDISGSLGCLVHFYFLLSECA